MVEKSYIFQFEVDCGLITKFNVLFHFIVVFSWKRVALSLHHTIRKWSFCLQNSWGAKIIIFLHCTSNYESNSNRKIRVSKGVFAQVMLIACMSTTQLGICELIESWAWRWMACLLANTFSLRLDGHQSSRTYKRGYNTTGSLHQRVSMVSFMKYIVNSRTHWNESLFRGITRKFADLRDSSVYPRTY